jgi:hypothetical protein
MDWNAQPNTFRPIPLFRRRWMRHGDMHESAAIRREDYQHEQES